MTFRDKTGSAFAPILVVPKCGGKTPGVDRLGALPELSTLKLPVNARGDEYHVLGIATSRTPGAGGNDYWVVDVLEHGGCDGHCMAARAVPVANNIRFTKAALITPDDMPGAPGTLFLVAPPATYTVHLDGMDNSLDVARK